MKKRIIFLILCMVFCKAQAALDEVAPRVVRLSTLANPYQKMEEPVVQEPQAGVHVVNIQQPSRASQLCRAGCVGCAAGVCFGGCVTGGVGWLVGFCYGLSGAKLGFATAISAVVFGGASGAIVGAGAVVIEKIRNS